tara:strand:+ start:462 stop:683 length:222 start_codon:yes stop_codon:yes gene_type:complete
MIKKIIIFVFLFIISTINIILFSKESFIENNEIQKFDDEMPFIQGKGIFNIHAWYSRINRRLSKPKFLLIEQD